MRGVIEKNMVTGVKKVYRSIIEAANNHNVSPRSIWGMIKSKRKLHDCMFDYNDGRASQPKKSNAMLKKKDVTLNSSYDLRSFEMKFNTICITPCHRKYKEDGSHIYIGSALCQHCSSYKGINREEMKVACSFKYVQQKDGKTDD